MPFDTVANSTFARSRSPYQPNCIIYPYPPTKPAPTAPSHAKIKAVLRFLVVSVLVIIAITVLCRALLSVAYTEATYDLAQQSNANHGSTFSEVLQGISDESYEFIALFTADGQKLYEGTSYDENRVWVDFKYFNHAYMVNHKQKLTHLHNHPIDASFSSTDLLNASNDYSGQFVDKQVIVSNQYVRTLTVGISGWPDMAATQAFLERHLNDIYAAQARGYVVIENIGTSDSVPLTYSSTDLLVQLYAETFGLIYTIEPLSNYT